MTVLRKVSSKMDCFMVKAVITCPMDASLLACGKMAIITVMAFSINKMAPSNEENGKTK